jgi:aminoglycoside 3-N-acetyltransferase
MVDYRYHKKFTAKYIDEDHIETRRTYGLFVRDLDRGVVTHVNPMGELLWNNGLYFGDRPKVGNGLRTINANDLFNFVLKYIEQGKAEGILFRIEKGESS